MKRPARLSPSFVKTVRTPGCYGDGHGGFGLALLVKASKSGRVSKSWTQRVRFDGRQTNTGLGAYPLVTLAEARALALQNARDMKRGINPMTGGIPTFADAAERVINLHEPTWKHGARSAKIWRSSLREYAYPRLADRKVDTITPADIMAVLTPIWTTKAETAKRVRQRIGAIMKWSIATGYRADNPAGDAISAAMPKNAVKKKHHRSLPYAEVPAGIRTIRETGAHISTRLAFEFLVLTAARSGEVRSATWDEIDFDSATWTVPGERMKSGREHRVPLSHRALAILRESVDHADGSGLVFPSSRGKVISDATVSKLIRENGIDAVPHGFRSSFKNWAMERTNFPGDLSEMALAHERKNKVEAAYYRTDLLKNGVT